METVPENQEEIIIGLENKVRELKKEIEEIKNSSSASDESYKEQISSLEGQLIVLQRSFNDMKRQSSQTLSEKANEIKRLSAIVKNLRKQGEDLNKKIQENERKYLYVECTKDIEARKFKDAEEKLKQINNETETSNVVKQVYSGRINNFPLLLEFGKSIGDAKLKFWVYESLSVEMENTQPIDLPKTAELAKALRIGCIDRTNVPNDIRGKARGIFEKLRSLVVGANDLCHATTMHHAAEMGDLDVVRLLIDGRAYVDYQDQQLKTPLYYAAEMGNLDVGRLLIDKGADVNHQDEYLQTPLYLAAEEGKLDVVRLLIDKGADVNHQDEYLQTPLHYAAEMGKLDVVRLLIDSGAYVDSKGKYFETPLQLAAKVGKLDVVRLLIDKGADVNHRDQQSRTALEYATSNSRFDVVKFLKEKQGLRSRRDVKELGNVSNSTLGSLQESVKPSSYVSDIVLEKTKESNSSFVLK